MKKITVEINNRKYTFTTGEEEWVISSIAKRINLDLREIQNKNVGGSDIDAMVMLLVNYLDTANKNKSELTHLRGQLQSYIHEADALKKQVTMLEAEKYRNEKMKKGN